MTDWGCAIWRTLVAQLLFWSTTAGAVGPQRDTPVYKPPSMQQYARDLLADDRPRRSYAARVLLRQARAAKRRATRRTGERTDIDIARQILDDFDTLVAPKCIDRLSVDELTRPCVLILEILETQAAVPELNRQLTREPRPALQRRIRRAMNVIRAAAETP